MLSAVMAGGLGFAFWSLIAHRQDASAVGSVTAEVSSITALAGVGSLNLINVFARFLPQAGWDARRLILASYGGAALAGLLAATVFLFTPWAAGLVLGGDLGRLAFVVCVVLTSVFMIQDGGLVGFGRSGWVPVENILVASARLALLPLGAMFLSEPIGVLWSWAVPMVVAVLIVNVLIIGRLAGQHKTQRPSLPTFGELGRFVAIESVTTAVSAAVSTFLPALVTQRLGASKGGYFYVPWIIATMVSLLLSSILISMVREAIANPEKADLTIRRSIGLALLVVTGAMIACLLLPGLVLAPLGADFAAYGAPLLRWVGLALPATSLNLLYWATCLVRRHPWPVLAVNLATSGAVVGGVMLLGPSSDISSVGMIYCMVQWGVAFAVSIPTVKALRIVRQRQELR
jgi:O-antigen/teichoic acid export membrane protein